MICVPSRESRQSQLRPQVPLVQGLTVNGFDDNGIFLFCVDNWRVQGNSANNNVEYGIFPSHCGPGEIVHNVATGSNDTGIYVGQSHDVRVDQNLAMGNVSGFELENCSNSRVDHNESTGNTAGILTFTNIFLDVKENTNNRVDHNNVHDNNKKNSCLNPADEVCAVPRGTGLLVLAADFNIVDHNTVTGNGSFGIAVANYCVANNLTPAQCAELDIEPNPDNDQILQNVATGNGTDPDPSVPPGVHRRPCLGRDRDRQLLETQRRGHAVPAGAPRLLSDTSRSGQGAKSLEALRPLYVPGSLGLDILDEGINRLHVVVILNGDPVIR